MTSITPPRSSTQDPDRLLDCQMAMEDAFQQLAEAAEAVGWTADEVALALVELAGNHVLARMANAETSAAIGAHRQRQ